ncbi:MAG: hypothetical protein ACKOXT_05160 [Actinomycetota bacterium]
MKLLKAEIRKLIYSRSSYGILLASILLACIGTVITPIVISNDETGLLGSLSDVQMVDGVYSKAISSYIFAIILGIILLSGEFRHGTAVATFLVSPKRSKVLFAKLGVAALAGAVMQTTASLVAMAGANVTLSFLDAAKPSEDVFINVPLAAALSGAVLGVVGVAIGSLIRNQLIAIVSTLVWLFVVEPLVVLLFVDAGKYLPTGAITGMLALDIQVEEVGVNTTNFLPPQLAALVLLGYGAFFALLALFTSLQRDID